MYVEVTNTTGVGINLPAFAEGDNAESSMPEGNASKLCKPLAKTKVHHAILQRLLPNDHGNVGHAGVCSAFERGLLTIGDEVGVPHVEHAPAK